MPTARSSNARKLARQDPNAEREVPEDEKRFVEGLLTRIERAKELRRSFDTQTLPKLRRLTWGTQRPDASQSDTRVNLIFATLATMLPHIYAKNPEIAVTPSEAVSDNEYDEWKAFGRTGQVFLNRCLVKEAGLKRRAKANVRSTMTTSVGWIKMVFQENLVGKDAIIMRRVNDMQDNLRRIEYLMGKVKDSPDLPGMQAQREELRNQLRALMQSNEVKVFKGFALDRVATEDLFILDESVVEFDDYVHADALAHRIWMSDEKWEETFGRKPGTGATEFDSRGGQARGEDGEGIALSDKSAKALKYREVFEVWDRTSNTVYTVASGHKGYCREPFVPKCTPQRWYPFYALGFNLVDGRWRPISDVELLMKLQEEYSTTRYLYAEARKEAIPTRVFRKAGGLTDDDIKALKDRRAREWIGIEGNPTVPLNQDLLQLDGVAIDPAAYDVTLIRNDMDMVVGMSDASRANLIEAKTATEAEIMRAAMQNRVAERQDTNEDLLSEMAEGALEIGLQKFSEAEIKELCGDDAAWPQLPVEEIFHKMQVQVRAGSTGRPNQKQEREQWTALVPVINETTKEILELRAAGAFDLADAKLELLRETLRRFDERIDLDALVPPVQRDTAGQPVAAQNAMAQAQQSAEALAACQEELAKCQQALQQCELQLQQAKGNDAEKAAKIQADAVIKVAQENAKAAEAQKQETVESERVRQDSDQKRAQAETQAEADVRKSIVTATTQFVIARMKPEPAKPGKDGEPGEPGKVPDINMVLDEAAKFAAQLEAVTGLSA